MKIITVTLSPAFDVHCSAPGLRLYHENLAQVISRDAGGKGVNISRALTLNGVDNLAFVVLGEENGDSFAAALKSEAIPFRHLTVKGSIRENITCHTAGAPETRISFKGFDVDDGLLLKTEEALLPEIDQNTVLTFTGRVPSGISMGAVKGLLRRFSESGARIVIDSRSFSLDDLRELRPWLIKPNQEEISEYLGREIGDFGEIISAAEALYKDGIENVMISLGGEGAMLVNRDGAFVARPPRIDAVSTIGAGDSSIAGFLAASACGASSADALCAAVAYGSAACLTEGTKPPRKEDITELLPRVSLKKL